MRRYFSYVIFFFVFCLSSHQLFSQGVGDRRNVPDYIDSIQIRADTTRATSEKVRLLVELTQLSVDTSKSAGYAEQAIELAQESQDQRLIATTYVGIGRHFLSNSSLSDNLNKALNSFKQAEAVARENGFEDVLVRVYCGLSTAWGDRRDNSKALNFCTQALAIASGIDNDSAKTKAYSVTGDVYLDMHQTLLALRNYLTELDVAEKNGDWTLLRNAYYDLTKFYGHIGETDKAIEYASKVYTLDREKWDAHMGDDLNTLGYFYLQKDQPLLAEKMYEHSMQMADTFHFPLMRVEGYHKMFLLYTKTHQYKRGLIYLLSKPELLSVLRGAGFSFYIDELMAINYTQQGMYDSAYHYFKGAEPEAEVRWVPENRFDFYTEFGNYYRQTKNLGQAIVYYNKAYALGAASAQLDMEEKSTDTLESLYEAAGNFPAALVCNKRAMAERDSIRTQGQATELMKLEVENEGRRRDRLAREEQERTEHRHNIQYMGFTMGLVVLFIALVMLARLSVPVSLIRAFVFVAFIFLFEFIIMLADKQIQGWTAEEPWKVLLLKIILAAGMVPAHHWLEHQVVHYLSHHKKKHPAGRVPIVPAENVVKS